MTDLELIRELREQARIYTEAAKLLEHGTTRATTSTTSKRQLSATARRKISLAQKKRWANVAVINGRKKKAA